MAQTALLAVDAGLYAAAQRPADDHRGARIALHAGVLPDALRAGGRGAMAGDREDWGAEEGNRDGALIGEDGSHEQQTPIQIRFAPGLTRYPSGKNILHKLSKCE